MKMTILGTGVMGFAVCERLLHENCLVVVYNRTRDKAKPLEASGAIVKKNAYEAIVSSDVVLLFLSSFSAIKEVLMQKPESLSSKTIIQMGTISSSESKYLKNMVEEYNGYYMECPALGSRKEASEGHLILMVGSTQEQFEEFKNIFSLLGKHIYYVGLVGQAATLKLALNQLIASYAASFSLSMGLVKNKEVDVEIFSDILKKSSLYTPMFDKKLPRWINGDYSHPNFSLKNLLKDVDLVCRESQESGVNCEMMETLKKIISRALEHGFAELDYSSLYKEIAE